MTGQSKKHESWQSKMSQLNQGKKSLADPLAFIQNPKLRAWLEWCSVERIKNRGNVMTPAEIAEMILEGVAKRDSGPLLEPSEYAAMIEETQKELYVRKQKSSSPRRD